MEHQTRQQAVDYINDLCEQAGCNERIAKIHQAQYVDRNWHPHPPQNFVDWWSRHTDCSEMTTVKIAYNCQRYRDEYLEHKSVGLA